MKSEERGRERFSGEDRKAQIIDVALTLFAQKGFSATRTREIAEAAGISETLIFQHFKTKKELIRAALDELFHSHPVSKELGTSLEKAKDDASFFRTIALHFMKRSREDPRIMKLAIYSSLEGGHAGELTREEENGPSVLNLITGHIQKRINEDVFARANAELVARLFVDAVFMYIADQTSAITGPPMAVSDDEAADTLAKIFLAGLEGR